MLKDTIVSLSRKGITVGELIRVMYEEYPDEVERAYEKVHMWDVKAAIRCPKHDLQPMIEVSDTSSGCGECY